MVRISDVIGALETWAPRKTQQSYDNVGLQVGDAAAPVSRAVIALDLTPAVVDEAVGKQAELVITHHPLIFRPLRTVASHDWHGSMILKLARAGVALYCIHTNLDAARGGVSFALAQQLGLKEIRFLKPTIESSSIEEAGYDLHPPETTMDETGMGAIGELPKPETLRDFLSRAAGALSTDGLRFVGDLNSNVQGVAVCGGAGSDLIIDAMREGADAYLTADITYHRFFDVLDTAGKPRMALIDAMHYETEACTEALLKNWLSERFTQIDWMVTETRTSPVQIFFNK